MATPDQLAAMQQQHDLQLQQQRNQTEADMARLNSEMHAGLNALRTANAEAASIAAAAAAPAKETNETMLKLILSQRDETSSNKPKTKWSEKLSEKA